MINIVYFLCDGNKEECIGEENCYKNGGDCKRTTDVTHAKNFRKVKKDKK